MNGIKQNQLELEKNVQDLANNNHISVLEMKTKNLLLNKPEYLFDSKIFSCLKPNEFFFQYDRFELISDEAKQEMWIDLGDNLIIRPLKRDDFDRGYMQLMAQLTEIGTVNKSDFERRFDQMRDSLNTYYICVVEDTQARKCVASLTLVYEQKFIRQTSARGRVEDVVTDVDYRGKRLSKILLDLISQLSKHLNCYKVSLECKDPLRKLYEQFGFVLESGQNYLCRRFI